MINDDDQTANFLGRGWAFPIEFSEGTEQIEMALGEEDIEQSLVILLSTQIGERVTQLDYGTLVADYAFEKLDFSSATLLEDSVKTAIINYESRVIVENINSDLDIENGYILMNIEYTVRSTNTRTNIVYPFYFNEGTNL